MMPVSATVHVKTGARVGEPQGPCRSSAGFVSDRLGDLEQVPFSPCASVCSAAKQTVSLNLDALLYFRIADRVICLSQS